ncbi:hypothetical protein D3C78_1706620 [compost metagenome]
MGGIRLRHLIAIGQTACGDDGSQREIVHSEAMPRQGRLERLLPAGSFVDPHSGMNSQFTAISCLPGTGFELFFPKRN